MKRSIFIAIVISASICAIILTYLYYANTNKPAKQTKQTENTEQKEPLPTLSSTIIRSLDNLLATDESTKKFNELVKSAYNIEIAQLKSPATIIIPNINSYTFNEKNKTITENNKTIPIKTFVDSHIIDGYINMNRANYPTIPAQGNTIMTTQEIETRSKEKITIDFKNKQIKNKNIKEISHVQSVHIILLE